MVNLQAGTSLNVIKRYWYIAIALLLLTGFATLHIPFVSQKIQSYAISSTEELFGSQLLLPVHEKKVREIAQKLGITHTIHIRKMNAQILQHLGYHNAFAYFPHFLNIFPLGDQAFMYISEGFFEDLNSEEQDFLIGHELVHIKQEHTKYAPVICFVLFILMTLGVWLLRKNFAVLHYWMASIGLWLALMWIINVGHLFYRRHIEREADIHSLERLETHNGMLKIIERWMREYKTPLHHNYYGMFSDHPSIWQRRTYCLDSQQNYKGS
jgi:Zn-dependent protease with chaperone function